MMIARETPEHPIRLRDVRLVRERLSEMPPAQRDRFTAYVIAGVGVAFIVFFLEASLPIALLIAPPTASSFAPTPGPVSWDTLALVLLWNGVAAGLGVIAGSLLLLARSVLRQFDLIAAERPSARERIPGPTVGAVRRKPSGIYARSEGTTPRFRTE